MQDSPLQYGLSRADHFDRLPHRLRDHAVEFRRSTWFLASPILRHTGLGASDSNRAFAALATFSFWIEGRLADKAARLNKPESYEFRVVGNDCACFSPQHVWAASAVSRVSDGSRRARAWPRVTVAPIDHSATIFPDTRNAVRFLPRGLHT